MIASAIEFVGAAAAAFTLGTFGEFGIGWAALGVAGAALEPPRRKRFLVAASAAPAAVGINFLVKLAVGRNRPVIEGHPPLGPAPNKLSFPSAHATPMARDESNPACRSP